MLSFKNTQFHNSSILSNFSIPVIQFHHADNFLLCNSIIPHNSSILFFYLIPITSTIPNDENQSWNRMIRSIPSSISAAFQQRLINWSGRRRWIKKNRRMKEWVRRGRGEIKIVWVAVWSLIAGNGIIPAMNHRQYPSLSSLELEQWPIDSIVVAFLVCCSPWCTMEQVIVNVHQVSFTIRTLQPAAIPRFYRWYNPPHTRFLTLLLLVMFLWNIILSHKC